jgi:hypothetical protein
VGTLTRSEILRSAGTLARYRKLVLLGRLRLPLAEARRLLGPDCAYHLYFRHARHGRPRRGSTTPPRG